MATSESDGLLMPLTANGPALVPSSRSPPRSRAPGRRVEGSPEALPTQEWSPPKSTPGQVAHATASSSQSATHSPRFPTMSLAPQLETQAALAPVFATEPVLTLQSVESGVPAAAV